MPIARVNGVALHHALVGEGEPIVLVHGSWDSHADWNLLVPLLAPPFRVVTYDRRGHGRSERSAGQGSVREDVADLAALIEALDLAPAWVAGNSFGGSITLRLAAERPDVVRGIVAHEPPLFALLAGDARFAPLLDEVARRIEAVVARIASGDDAGAAEQFVDTVALGPGAWAGLPLEMRATLTENAPTFLDEARDPEQLTIDLEALRSFTKPVLLTRGGQSPPIFAPVIDRLAAVLPQARVVDLGEAGHVPHATHPELWAQHLLDFMRSRGT
jgi:pimeloyl-ACP methyl ester carboxylesterase